MLYEYACPICTKICEHTEGINHAGGCSKTSPHLDWYEGLYDTVAQIKAQILERWHEGAAH
ncbi:MAG: hypothetical protein QM541_03820 [Flavobacterium sp.]|nr:hypothetical protein [Flavobacterium sp.]